LGENAGLPHVEPDPYEVVQAQHVVGARRRRRRVSWRIWAGLGAAELVGGVSLLMARDWLTAASTLLLGTYWTSTALQLFRRRARAGPATRPPQPSGH
jgi:hypothetical protein